MLLSTSALLAPPAVVQAATPSVSTEEAQEKVAGEVPQDYTVGDRLDRGVVPIQWSTFNTSVTPIPESQSNVDRTWDRYRRQLAKEVENVMLKTGYVAGEDTYIQVDRCSTSRAAGEMAADAMGLAIAVKLGAYPYAPYNNFSWTQVKDKAALLTRSLGKWNYANTPQIPGPLYGWGTIIGDDAPGVAEPYPTSPPLPNVCPQNWISSSFPAAHASFAAWLLWDYLTPTDKEYVSKMVEYEANRFILDPYFTQEHAIAIGPPRPSPTPTPYREWLNVGYRRDRYGKFNHPFPHVSRDEDIGDTKAEEDAWMAKLLLVATAMLPNHPNWDSWMNKGLEMTIGALARPADTNNSNVFDKLHNKTLHDWLNGSNIEDSGVIINSQRIHPNYFNSIGNTLFGVAAFTLARRSSPKGFFHNTDLVYGSMVPPATVTPRAGYTPSCPNGQPYQTLGNTIYLPGQQFVCYPEGLGGADKYPRIDVFALMDTLAKAYGFYNTVEAANWEDLHTQGVVATAMPTYPRPEASPSPTIVPVAPPTIDKLSEAYVVKWLEKQAYFRPGAMNLWASDLPHTWRNQDVGAVGKLGTTKYFQDPNNGDTFTLSATGAYPGEQEERFQFSYKLWQGDGEIVARKETWNPPSCNECNPQAGIMIREDLTANARYARVLFQNSMNNGNTSYFKWRTAVGAQSGHSYGEPGGSFTGNYVKLVRRGNVFTAYGSTDGVTWTQIGQPIAINMSHRVYVGLAASSLDSADGNFVTKFVRVKVAKLSSTQLSNPNTLVTASINPQAAPNTLDEQLQSTWSATDTGHGIGYDLGALKKVDSVAIAWFGGLQAAGENLPPQRIQSFNIQVSIEGLTDSAYWTTVMTATSSGATHNLELFTFMPVAARYVRIVGHGNTMGPLATIKEVQIFGSALTENITLSPAITTSDGEDGTPTVNGSLDDANGTWADEGDGVWIQYQFQNPGGRKPTVGSIAIAWWRGDIRSTYFDVLVSSDGVNWTTVLTRVKSTGATKALELYTFPNPMGNVDYVRIVGHANTDGPWTHITEVKIFSQN